MDILTITGTLRVAPTATVRKTQSFSIPGVDEAALEPESSSEELRPELLPRLRLALSGTDTLAEVDLVTDISSNFS